MYDWSISVFSCSIGISQKVEIVYIVAIHGNTRTGESNLLFFFVSARKRRETRRKF